MTLSQELQCKLTSFCRLAVDQRRARVLIPPKEAAPGFWFGGGNLVAGSDGSFYLVGRYRNEGDSRTGLESGTRGLELAVFKSTDQCNSFHKLMSFTKRDLSPDGLPVLSIEGSALRVTEAGVELYVSSEKAGVRFAGAYQSYLKPGTGVWSIDRLSASSFAGLKSAPIESLLRSHEPSSIHVKDPFLYQSPDRLLMFFCSHPFSWTCSNTGYALIGQTSSRESAVFEFFPRGNVWDVAMSRGTCIVDVPAYGSFAGHHINLMFYDGGECVRNHVEHSASVSRPRGYSCEELGGAAYFVDRQWQTSKRLSPYEPLFVSPYGSGCSRYVDVLIRPEGMYVTWQQAQDDGSQPLVFNFVSKSEIESVLV